MNIFAEYFEIENRRGITLLQFGESIELIGSAVLKNPGSAKPLRSINNIELNTVNTFFKNTHKKNIPSGDCWYKFAKDSTMIQLERLFNGSLLANEKYIQLNGIIQLFNCFYYITEKSKDAEKIFQEYYKNKKEFIFNESEYFLDKPVYFGWGETGLNGKYKKIAKYIFDEYMKNGIHKDLYESNFEENCFSHPYSFSFIKNISRLNNFLVDFNIKFKT